MRRRGKLSYAAFAGCLVVAGAALAAAPAPGTGHVPQGAPGSWPLLERYCADCHNTVDWAGGFSIEGLGPDAVESDPAAWEKVIRKLRTGMMPPPGKPRPAGKQVDALSQYLESRLDDQWQRQPKPGAKSLHRLNRTEYANAIRDLLRLEVDVSTLLPADDAAEGFDNMADVLSVSPTLVQAQVSTAMKISRLAVGDPGMAPVLAKFSAPGGAAQRGHVEGLPLGTRGGLRIVHNFPLDAEYEFRVNAGGGFRFAGPAGGPPPRVDVTLNGKPVEVPDPRRFRIRVPAGPQVVTVAMVDQVRADGVDSLYAQATPRRDDVEGVTIQGPFNPTGAGDTPSRREIFVCRPANAAEELPCARRILARLASAAFRVEQAEDSPAVELLLQFHQRGSREGGFDTGIQQALARLLVDSRFLYRAEGERGGAAAGAPYRISDEELASRLSFFLWSSIPDARLRELAQRKTLHEPATLEQEVRRMLADPRAASLTTNFAGQWLHLRELANAQPIDRGFDDSLRNAMAQETQLLFASLLRDNRSVVTLLDADYTFLNERLARHYGIAGVRGAYMRRVALPKNSPRRGLLGQGSILTVTSAGNRTSPVMRGAWVMETLLGSPVPAPPPGVEADLKENAQGARPMSVRERLEKHRENPTCASCHQLMDPIGFAMENFDLLGRWRDSDSGVPVNARAELGDGTPVNGVNDLRTVLLSHSDEFVTSISERLLQYALGRRLEYFDQPAVRRIVADAGKENHTLTALVQAVVRSAPFQMRLQPAPAVQ
jgi:mono/diheme cytochrome c family protein